jgi:hypothetical protein
MAMDKIITMILIATAAVARFTISLEEPIFDLPF